jgi:catalase
LFEKGGISEGELDNDDGLISLADGTIDDFITAASAGRIWAREPTVRLVA